MCTFGDEIPPYQITSKYEKFSLDIWRQSHFLEICETTISQGGEILFIIFTWETQSGSWQNQIIVPSVTVLHTYHNEVYRGPQGRCFRLLKCITFVVGLTKKHWATHTAAPYEMWLLRWLVVSYCQRRQNQQQPLPSYFGNNHREHFKKRLTIISGGEKKEAIHDTWSKNQSLDRFWNLFYKNILKIQMDLLAVWWQRNRRKVDTLCSLLTQLVWFISDSKYAVCRCCC